MNSAQVLHIKNMVCPRCITTVRDTLRAMGLNVNKVVLGEAEFDTPDNKLNLKTIDNELRKNGFELLIDKDEQLVEQVKVALIEYLTNLEKQEEAERVSSYLSHHLTTPYTQLSKLFSQRVGHTIEKHVILLKIERVKELLTYGELTLSEIAYRLHYSSVQHLSTQFRQVTGLSVSEYKSLGTHHRHPLDAISSTTYPRFVDS